MKEFSKRNRQRCESPNGFKHKLSDWSMSDWMTATLGELGEAANVIKKLNRIRDSVPGNSETLYELLAQLKSELADTYIYLDLMIQACGWDPEEIVEEIFKRKSEQIGYVEL